MELVSSATKFERGPGTLSGPFPLGSAQGWAVAHWGLDTLSGLVGDREVPRIAKGITFLPT